VELKVHGKYDQLVLRTKTTPIFTPRSTVPSKSLQGLWIVLKQLREFRARYVVERKQVVVLNDVGHLFPLDARDCRIYEYCLATNHSSLTAIT